MIPAERQRLRTDLLRSVSRSFYLSMRVLPAPMREPVSLAYLLARASDTLADTAEVPVPSRKECLDDFREGAMTARVKTGRAAVRADADVRVLQQPRLQFVVHDEVGAGSAARADHVDQHVFERHLHFMRNIRQRPAGP